MRLTSTIFIALGFLTASVCGQTTNGAAAAARPITLAESIELALAHNLELKIERYNPQMMKYELQQQYGAYDPQFGVSAEHRRTVREGGIDDRTGLPLGNTVDEEDVVSSSLGGESPTGLRYGLSMQASEGAQTRGILGGSVETVYSQGLAGVGFSGFGLSQSLLKDFWIDQNRLRIRTARKDLQISDLTFSFTVMDVVYRVQQAYYELIFSRDYVVVQEKAVELAERLLFETKKKVEVGTLAPLEETKAEAEKERARAALIQAQYLTTVAQSTFKNLLTDNFAEWNRQELVPGEKMEAVPYPSDISDNWLTALSQRPDYAVRLLELEKADITTKFTRNQLFPTLDAYGTYGHGAYDEVRGAFADAFQDFNHGNAPRHSYGLRFSIPLSRTAERNAHKSAKAARDQVQVRVKKLEQDILFQINDAVNLVKSTFQGVSATRQARVFAEAALDAEQKKFENGKSTSYLVLQYQRDLTQARSAEIRALADYNQALSTLQYRQGNTLREARIDLEPVR